MENNDSIIYSQVILEIQQGKFDNGLKAKAFVLFPNNPRALEAEYIKLRVEQIKNQTYQYNVPKKTFNINQIKISSETFFYFCLIFFFIASLFSDYLINYYFKFKFYELKLISLLYSNSDINSSLYILSIQNNFSTLDIFKFNYHIGKMINIIPFLVGLFIYVNIFNQIKNKILPIIILSLFFIAPTLGELNLLFLLLFFSISRK